MPNTDVPHPEERPEGARLEGRSVGAARIFAAFLRLGGTAFGGGTAGWLYREIVLRRRRVDDRTFLAMLGIGQVMPGSSGVSLTVLIGQRLAGPGGAIAALLGLLAFPFAIALAVGALYGGLGDHLVVQAMLDGVAASVIGLTFATGLRGLVQGTPGLARLAVAGATVLCVRILRWPILPVIAGLAPLSIALSLVQRRRV